MNRFPDTHHRITLMTAKREPLLTGELHRLAEHALKGLLARFPGLKIVRQAIHPDRVELEMDLSRLDEDVQRIVQSFKSEVKALARRKNLSGENLWQWGYLED
jgi:REP element-mobilizing transposase RayT